MAYEIADTAGAFRSGFQVGQSFMEPITEALRERAQIKQQQEVTARVQQQLNEMAQQGITDKTAYEELLARMNAGEDIDGEELLQAGRKTVVTSSIYNQNAMKIVNAEIAANPNNPFLQKSLGALASEIQGGTETAMKIGQMLTVQGAADEERETKAEQFDRNFAAEEDRFTRQESRLQTNADREYELRAAEIGERRADRAEEREARGRQEEREERKLKLVEEDAESEKKTGLIKRGVDLKAQRDELIAAGNDPDSVDSFFEAQGVSADEIETIRGMTDPDPEVEGMGEEDVSDLKEIEKLIEHEAGKKRPDKQRLQGLRAEAAELKSKTSAKKDEEIDRRLKARESRKRSEQVVKEYKAWAAGVASEYGSSGGGRVEE